MSTPTTTTATPSNAGATAPAAPAANAGAPAAAPAAATGAAPAAGAPAAAPAAGTQPAAAPAAAQGAQKSLLEEAVDEAQGGKPAADGQQPEQKPEGKPENGPAQGAPEKYEEFKLPDGQKMNPEALEKFSGVARELGLNQVQAQKLVDIQAQFVQTQNEKALAQYQEQVKAWRQETIQTLGPEYKKELAFAAKALDRFASPQLRQLLTQTGFGDHKEFAQFCIKAGKTLSEDSFAEGRSAGSDQRSVAERLYPSLAKSS